MNALVIYDSQYSNTEKIAQAIATGIGGGARAVHVKQATAADVQGVDLLVLGSPTVGFNALPAVLAWLDGLPPRALAKARAAAFDTRMHLPRWLFFARFAAPLLDKRLRKLAAQVAAAPEGFFVVDREGPLAEGELARAQAWGAQLGAVKGAVSE